MAFGTKAALFKPAGRVGTEAGDRTVTPVGTVSKRTAKAFGFLEKQVVAYFFRNGGTIPSESSANALKEAE